VLARSWITWWAFCVSQAGSKIASTVSVYRLLCCDVWRVDTPRDPPKLLNWAKAHWPTASPDTHSANYLFMLLTTIGLTTFNGNCELGCSVTDSIFCLEHVASGVVSAGVKDGQLAGRRCDVDGQVGTVRQRLTVAGPASCRRWNTSDDCFDDKLLTASERLRRLQLVIVTDRRCCYHNNDEYVTHFVTFTTRYDMFTLKSNVHWKLMVS